MASGAKCLQKCKKGRFSVLTAKLFDNIMQLTAGGQFFMTQETLKQSAGQLEEVINSRPTVPFKLEFDSRHEPISIDVPVSDRLKVGLEFHQLFPSSFLASRAKLFDSEGKLRYMERIADYLDAVLRITPESQDSYRKCLDGEADGFSFIKGDFTYVYIDKMHSFGRYTADDSGIILGQGFELGDDGLVASAALLEVDNGNVTYGSVSLSNPSAVFFIENVLSELSPGIVTGFNNLDWPVNYISQWDLVNQRDQFGKLNSSK